MDRFSRKVSPKPQQSSRLRRLNKISIILTIIASTVSYGIYWGYVQQKVILRKGANISLAENEKKAIEQGRKLMIQ